MPFISTNPATGDVVQQFTDLSDSELEQKLALTQSAFETWKATTLDERATLMRAMAVHLRSKATELATLMTLEMGKTVKAGAMEIEKCAAVCDFYAEKTKIFLAHEPVPKVPGTQVPGTETYVQFDPLGAILAVMPWNFPFWQVYRFAAPALMAGNVGLLKHASNVPQCAEAIEAAFVTCGFPKGVFQNLLIGSARVEGVIRDPRVKAVTLTGSEYAGSQVAKVAGEELKKTVLELGGSDPFIVLEDANVAESITAAVTARMQNNAGQSCIAAKRFIIHQEVAEQFIQGFTTAIAALVLGDPTDAATDVGPLATAQILQDISLQVSRSVELGARIMTGGKRRGDKGNFYEPTVLINVKKGMPAYDEEVFGPIAAVIVVADEAEAIRVANDTPYGLGATIFTQDMARAKRMIPQIDAGAVFINGPMKSDPRAPFGGIKKSGYGREMSHYGIKEFINVKNVWIK